MNYCNSKIEELLKRKNNKNENDKGNEQEISMSTTDIKSINANEVNDSNCTMNKMIQNVVQIVKLSNRLSEISFSGSVLEGQRNAKKIKEVGNEMLQTISNIALYSSSESTKELFQDQSLNNYLDLQNNYPFVSSVLEDTITRAYDCFKYFNNEYKTKSAEECCIKEYVQENEEEKQEEEQENRKEKNESSQGNSKDYDVMSNTIRGNSKNGGKKHDTLNRDTSHIIKEENQNENNRQETCVGDNNFINNGKSFCINYEGYIKEKSNDGGSCSKMLNLKKSQNGKIETTLKKKNNKYVPKNYLNKIQNAWLHLTNNYACFFIPRMSFKHNSLKDIDENLKEAIQIQEKYFHIKKKIMRYIETYKKEGYMWTSSEIIKEIRSMFEDNEKQNQINVNNVINEYPSDCSDSSGNSDLVDLEDRKVADEYFFIKVLEKLNKDLNKYKYKYSNLKNPYEYEINNIMQMYENENADILKFLVLHKIENIKIDGNKNFLFIDNKKNLTEMITYIKEKCDIISLNIKINFKKSYLGFIVLIFIGTKEIDYIIDTFPIFEELTELNEITSNPNILKITFNAENMIKFLQKDFSIYIVNMFDLFISARCLNLYNNSLNFLVFNYFNININDNDMNKSLDFLSRPLTQDVIDGIRNEYQYMLCLVEYLKMDLYFNYVLSGTDGFSTCRIPNMNVEEKKEKEEIESIKKKELGEALEDVINEKYLSNIKKSSENVYVNFQKVDYFDMNENEMGKVHGIIKRVFIESNKLCLNKYEVTEMYSINETKKQIQNIIKGSYTYKDRDTLIDNLLIWRKKLSKKIDVAPDNILNIHNIISIVLNVPTSISSLKNNIVPLSNVVMDNIEELLNVVSKSSLQNKSSRFYEHLVKPEIPYINKNNDEIYMDDYLQNGERKPNGEIKQNVEISEIIKKEENVEKGEYRDSKNKMSNVSALNNYNDFIVSSNFHMENAVAKKSKNVLNKPIIKESGEIEISNGKIIKGKDEESMYELEKTLFLSSEIDSLPTEGKCNAKWEKTSALKNVLTNNFTLKASRNFVKQLNKLNKKIKRKKTENEKQKQKSYSNIKNINISTIKTIDKNKTNVSPKERQNKKLMRMSYKQQYGIRNMKKGFSKNILSEII